MSTLALFFVLAVSGCAKEATTTEVAASNPTEQPAAATAQATPDEEKALPAFAKPPVDPAADPAAAYAECRDRVEKPETAGECSSDADCAKAGCAQEVCTSTTAAADLMTTCDSLPCFAVLDTCGCVAGTCDWSLTEAAGSD